MTYYSFGREQVLATDQRAGLAQPTFCLNLSSELKGNQNEDISLEHWLKYNFRGMIRSGGLFRLLFFEPIFDQQLVNGALLFEGTYPDCVSS